MKGNLEFGFIGKKRSWKVELRDWDVLYAGLAITFLVLAIKSFSKGSIILGVGYLGVCLLDLWCSKIKFTFTKKEDVSA